MPEYQARIPEIEAEVTKLRYLVNFEKIKPPAEIEATFKRLSEGITAYASFRELALTSSLLPLFVPDAQATGESQQKLWAAAHLKHGSDAFERFNSLVTSEPDPIQLTFELFAMQESAAFTVISRMPIAEAVGHIQAYIRRLEQETRTLEDLWKEQSGQTERMDAEINAVRAQVLDSYKRAVADIRGWGPKTEEALHTSIVIWDAKEQADPEPSVGSVAAAASANISSTAGQLRLTHEDAVHRSMLIYAGKLTIHMMFRNTRLQVKDFLDKVNKNTMRRLYDDACQAALAAAANVHQKDGLKLDAKRFVENAVAASSGILPKFDDAWEEFYTTFNGSYVGVPSEATIEKLAEAEFFNRFWPDVEYLDLPGAFRIAGEAIARCESISPSKITPEQKKRLDEVIQKRTNEMKETVRNMDMSLFQRVKLFYCDIPLDQFKDWIRRLGGYSK